ncbi:MAG: DUF1552 domain-containing protein [Myxococcota bacterium]|nr:DUF1552 domain-containing protein [Myxococcota bacterium]
MQRRQFLRGVGGVTLGLPMLDAFLPRSARAAGAAAATRSPFVAIMVNDNGVVQAGSAIGGSTDPEWFWPSVAGPLTTAAMAADSVNAASPRETGALSAYANRLLIVRGINHPFSAAGCGHAGADAQLLTGARCMGNGAKTLASGPSIDTLIANKMNPVAGTRDPLALHAGRYSTGGTGFDVPGYIAYIAAGQPRSTFSSPYKAYLQIIGNGASANLSAAAQQQILARTKSVNDFVRSQIQSLLMRPDLSSADVQRLNQHFAAIRDMEMQVTGQLAATEVAAMQAIDSTGTGAFDTVNHLANIKLQLDLMVFALQTDYTRAITLKIGDRVDEHIFTEDAPANFHAITHRSIPGAVTKHDRIVRYHFTMYQYLLDSLAKISTPTGTLLDDGLAIWTNQIANGNHSYVRVPWIISGTGVNPTTGASGYLKAGQFIDLPSAGADIGKAPSTNQMLNTLLNAAGVPTTAFGDPAAPQGIIAQLVR